MWMQWINRELMKQFSIWRRIRITHMLKILLAKLHLFTQIQGSLRILIFIIRKWLIRKHKFKGESACMNFKKSIFIVLGLSLTLVCGLGMNSVEKQAQDTIKVASDRLQT